VENQLAAEIFAMMLSIQYLKAPMLAYLEGFSPMFPTGEAMAKNFKFKMFN
jgi:hypothetical protein